MTDGVHERARSFEMPQLAEWGGYCACIVAVVVSTQVAVVHTANWAQTNGVKGQPTSLTARSPFSTRYGHACVTVDWTFDYVEEAEGFGFTELSVDRLICIGGDDFDERIGGGGLRNDVWETSGINWRIAEAQTILNEYEEPKVSTVSDMTWSRLAGNVEPPLVSYMTWLACPMLEMGLNPPPGVQCRPELEFDAEYHRKRFSPRRHHGAVTFRASGDSRSRIYVLGGRSRVLIDYPDGWERVHGGFTERLGASDAEGDHFREENALMNDIWVSPDLDNVDPGNTLLPGEDWGLVNPGCVTRYYPFTLPAEEQLWFCLLYTSPSPRDRG